MGDFGVATGAADVVVDGGGTNITTGVGVEVGVVVVVG
jgi:hypothetical protein